MANHNENYVTHNPFEGDNGAFTENDSIDVGIGFVVSFLYFTLMFVIAVIIDAVA